MLGQKCKLGKHALPPKLNSGKNVRDIEQDTLLPLSLCAAGGSLFCYAFYPRPSPSSLPPLQREGERFSLHPNGGGGNSPGAAFERSSSSICLYSAAVAHMR